MEVAKKLAITNPNWKLTVHSGWRFGIYGIPWVSSAILIRWRSLPLAILASRGPSWLKWLWCQNYPVRTDCVDLTWVETKDVLFFFGVMPYVCRQCACDKETQNINSCSLRKNPMTLPQIKVHNLEYLSLLQFCQRQAWLRHWIFIGFVFAFQVLHCKDGCNLSTAFVFLNHFCLPEKSVGPARASQIASCFPRWFGSGSKARKTHAIFVHHIFQMSNLSCIIGSMERWDMYRYVMFVLFCLVVIATFSWTCSFYTLDFMSFWCFFSHKEFTRLYVIILTDQ